MNDPYRPERFQLDFVPNHPKTLLLGRSLDLEFQAIWKSTFPQASLVSLDRYHAKRLDGVEVLPMGPGTAKLLRQRGYDFVVVLRPSSLIGVFAQSIRTPETRLYRLTQHGIIEEPAETLAKSLLSTGLNRASRLPKNALNQANRLKSKMTKGLSNRAKRLQWAAISLGRPNFFNDYEPLRIDVKPSDKPLITVVITTYNRIDYLRRTLAGLTHQTVPNTSFEIVLSDDGSREDIASVIPEFPELNIRFITQEDRGYRLAEARNRGIQEATTPYILLLDPDMIPCPRHLEITLSRLVQGPHPTVVVAHRAYIDASDVTVQAIRDDFRVIADRERIPSHMEVRSQLVEAHVDWREGIYRQSDMLKRHAHPYQCACGGNLGISRQFALDAGLFDASFTVWGAEDIEFGYRLYRRGGYFVPELDALGYHQDHPPTATREKNLDQFIARVPPRRKEGVWPDDPHFVRKFAVLTVVRSQDEAEAVEHLIESLSELAVPDGEFVVAYQCALEPRPEAPHITRFEVAEHPNALEAALDRARAEFVIHLLPDDRLQQSFYALVRLLERNHQTILAVGGFKQEQKRYNSGLYAYLGSAPTLLRAREAYRLKARFGLFTPDFYRAMVEQGHVRYDPRPAITRARLANRIHLTPKQRRLAALWA